jgi:hypothetical protein
LTTRACNGGSRGTSRPGAPPRTTPQSSSASLHRGYGRPGDRPGISISCRDCHALSASIRSTRHLWLDLLTGAGRRIWLYANASLFLPEDNPESIAIIRRMAEAGMDVRILMATASTTARVSPRSGNTIWAPSRRKASMLSGAGCDADHTRTIATRPARTSRSVSPISMVLAVSSWT